MEKIELYEDMTSLFRKMESNKKNKDQKITVNTSFGKVKLNPENEKYNLEELFKDIIGSASGEYEYECNLTSATDTKIDNIYTYSLSEMAILSFASYEEIKEEFGDDFGLDEDEYLSVIQCIVNYIKDNHIECEYVYNTRYNINDSLLIFGSFEDLDEFFEDDLENNFDDVDFKFYGYGYETIVAGVFTYGGLKNYASIKNFVEGYTPDDGNYDEEE